jgi:hypothetical protein
VAEEDKDKGRPYYCSIDGAGTEEIKEAEVSYESMGEIPVIVLKPSWSLRQLRMGLILGTCAVFLFYMARVLIPVLTTGDISSIYSDSSLFRKTMGFYLGMFVLIMLPYWVSFVLVPLFFNTGTFCFYSNRLEMIPIFSGGNKVVIMYKQMYVRYYKEAGGVAITSQSIPSWLHPFRRYRVFAWEKLSISGLGLPQRPQKFAGVQTSEPSPWENPGDLPKAVQILREKAFEFKEA